ncbi:adenylate/guanylate cyclase domain-containing protein [Bradyrhizobium sp. SSBR45G]|uniref:adenylate/guanylate cyclase domain-containing protein n=1 Tax=unclassified Bradyrhizobium TaxID=2631580 RepID=UPI002342A32D|nr:MULTISPECIES: adenylate/guanylate cyclase domain-containing protein [unclassified Bradyrhizobium]GLH82131.1 adenylate/guanylate cyclase domain-containing protein [Bradyrhizobium sp. SSBR45G]GLH89582.1 adenylate/guanylate cyclase domain-containing protein [Bradyrhizobium sp. SSBR45R]
MTISLYHRLKTVSRGIGVRQVRLICGLILFSYLLSHFLNHALGNVSLQALAIGVAYHLAFWQFLPVAIVFYAAALTHGGLGVWALYQRRQFSRSTLEPLQLILGLSIPALIFSHIAGVRLGHTLYGHDKLYPQVLYSYWAGPSWRVWLMSAALLTSWSHGCIGLHFWLRLKPFYQRAAPWLLACAVLIPALALLGFYRGGRDIISASATTQWRAENLSPKQTGTASEQATLETIMNGFLIGYLGLIGAVLAARGLRALHERRGGMVTLSYNNGRIIRVPKGLSVLEASHRNNVPHASTCGGRARCSTCRIRVIGDPSGLPAPSPREAFVLAQVGANDPSIRLACQLRPTDDLSFFQLFMPNLTPGEPGSQRAAIGQERYLVSLFVDMRGSTSLAEKRLPFDVVFIVNRFLGAVSQAVLSNGGQPNQFVGDGMLALFGLGVDPHVACRQAVQAAHDIAVNIAELNAVLSHDLHDPIRFGIGIHGGEVIVGEVGYRDHMVFTALGDAVNVASRLQDMTKTLGCQVIISDDVYERAGRASGLLPQQEVEIRGRAEPMRVRTAADAADLVSQSPTDEGAAA